MCIESKFVHRGDAENAEFFVGAEQKRCALPGLGTLAPSYYHRKDAESAELYLHDVKDKTIPPDRVSGAEDRNNPWR